MDILLDMKHLIQKVNYFFYRAKYRYGRSIQLTKPVDVSLELSSSCNMSCNYCYHSDQVLLPFTKGIMSLETAKSIISQAADLSVPSLKFNWKGESTINPHFSQITAYAKSLAKGSTFIDRLTNSNFKFRTDRDDIFDGLCNQTKVKVSYDSFRKDVFETQRAGGDHTITTRNIDKFYHYPKRKNTEIVIQAVRTKLNADEDIRTMVRQRWPEAEISIRDMVAGRVEKDLSQLENRTRDDSERQSCLQAHVRIIFNYAGRAYPCCPDVAEKLCIGDIRTMSMFEIFNGATAKHLRTSLKNGRAFQMNPCKGCSSFETFKNYKPAWNS
jgi:radical SAM protein with 4Fe4S-binding SPASM domain